MKYLLSSLCLIFIFVSCQKEITEDILSENPIDTTIVVNPGVTGVFKAKINGVQWIANKGAAAGISTPTALLPSIINITGISTDNRTITISLENRGKQLYKIYDTSWAAGAYTGDSTSSLSYTTNQGPAGQAGTVEITVLDTVKKVMSGKFSFIVYKQADSSSITITEGEFTDIPLTVGNVLPPPSLTDTFRVKVNDTPFVLYSINATFMSFNNSITVQASDSLVQSTVGVTFPSSVTPGNYTIDFFGSANAFYNNPSTQMGGDNGTIQILEHNTVTKRVRGNFNGTVSALLSPDSAKLTQGYFSVIYK